MEMMIPVTAVMVMEMVMGVMVTVIQVQVAVQHVAALVILDVMHSAILLERSRAAVFQMQLWQEY